MQATLGGSLDAHARALQKDKEQPIAGRAAAQVLRQAPAGRAATWSRRFAAERAAGCSGRFASVDLLCVRGVSESMLCWRRGTAGTPDLHEVHTPTRQP
eukprot:CAMPEP_0119393330 /NCGR_PEP_ID=MMETSP1334-20130426/124965_1 /TAXON_ID=127549 /ORGANISM="Calcidiscus leptoporus, Strain RCC1130" /LENGTH=98 /DNA_ID=CAMNT_0007416361 /DNA_START=122 /DNA_END=415 /DNA_ORIENTATION=+